VSCLLLLLLAGVFPMLVILEEATVGATDPMGTAQKLRLHIGRSVGPWSLVGSVVYATVLHGADNPRGERQNAQGYGRRFASTVGTIDLRNVLRLDWTPRSGKIQTTFDPGKVA
jgi:hypothetical protein